NGVTRICTNHGRNQIRYPGHITPKVDDHEQRAAGTIDAGLAVVRIPTNFYPELEARFGLDDATVRSWQRLGILYDRNADGEFMHLYSETLGGLFIELVQRIGSYQGYGPGNAAVRLAAQEQHEQQRRL